MKRFICYQKKHFSSIINICEEENGVITFTNSKNETITEPASNLPEGFILAHPRGIEVAPDMQQWLKENPQHKNKPFEPDFSLKEGKTQISKHLHIYLKPEADKIIWNHTTHNTMQQNTQAENPILVPFSDSFDTTAECSLTFYNITAAEWDIIESAFGESVGGLGIAQEKATGDNYVFHGGLGVLVRKSTKAERTKKWQEIAYRYQV